MLNIKIQPSKIRKIKEIKRCLLCNSQHLDLPLLIGEHQGCLGLPYCNAKNEDDCWCYENGSSFYYICPIKYRLVLIDDGYIEGLPNDYYLKEKSKFPGIYPELEYMQITLGW
jgi:hypothetical protein